MDNMEIDHAHSYYFLFIYIQANNAYIFPGLGFGLVISGAIRVHDEMLLAACKYQLYFLP